MNNLEYRLCPECGEKSFQREYWAPIVCDTCGGTGKIKDTLASERRLNRLIEECDRRNDDPYAFRPMGIKHG